MSRRPKVPFVADFPNIDLKKLARALARFDARSAVRGREYARGGRVLALDVDVEGQGFEADVRGTRKYHCEWMIRGTRHTTACSCPIGGDCKHVYAAACTLFAHLLASKLGTVRQHADAMSFQPVKLDAAKLPPMRILDLANEIEAGEDYDEDCEDDFDDEDADYDGDDFEEDEDDFKKSVRASAAGSRGLPPLVRVVAPSALALRKQLLAATKVARLRRQATSNQRGAAARAAAPPEVPALLAALREAATGHDRNRYVREICRGLGVTFERLIHWDLADEADGDIRCALLVSRLSRIVPTVLPEDVLAFLRSPAAQEKMHRRSEAALRRQLDEWAQPVRKFHDKHLRLTLRPGLDGDGRLYVEMFALLSSARLRDDLRRPEQLRVLLDESNRAPGLLSPESHALLEWTCGYFSVAGWWQTSRIAGEDLERLLLDFGHTGLVTWDTSGAEQALSRAGISHGDVATHSRETASIEPACAIEGGVARMQLVVRLGSERRCSLDEVTRLQGHRSAAASYLLAAGTLWRVVAEPPAHVVDGFGVVGKLELEAEQSIGTLRRLATSYPGIAETIEQVTRRVPSRAIFLLDGDDDETLRVRLFAVAQDLSPPAERAGDCGRERPAASASGLFEYVADGQWEYRRADDARASPLLARFGEPHSARPPAGGARELRWLELPGPSATLPRDGDRDGDVATEAPAPEDRAGLPFHATDASPPTWKDVGAGGDAWLFAPDRECTEPAAEWLRSLCPQPGQFDGDAWVLSLRPPRFAPLADAWDARPAGATFLATRRIHRLLRDSPPRPKLDIRADGKDWFGVRVEWQIEGEALGPGDIDALLTSREEFVRLRDGWVRRAVRDDVDAAAEALADVGIDLSQPGEEQRLGIWQLASAPAGALDRLEMLGADPSTVAMAKALRRKVAAFRGVPRVAVPRTFRGELRGYQRDGLDFLSFLSSLGAGAVLADDMGLGKTIQTLAWLERLRLAGNHRGPALVVCPASVVHNWLEEAVRFTPGMRVVALTRGAERRELLERTREYDLVVVNYALLRRDVEHWSKVELRALVLDEAQNVKNPDAAVSRAVRDLKARHRLALTGTPIENRTRDLWSIVECVSPGYFGTRKRFEERFDRGTVGEAERRLLAAKLRPIMLRRRKHEVAPDLPARIEETRRCELTAEQRKLYLATLRASRQLVDRLGRKGPEGEKARIQILAALMRLRQICCHPGLVDPSLAGASSSKFDLLIEVLEPLLELPRPAMWFAYPGMYGGFSYRLEGTRTEPVLTSESWC
ncbi:MAG: SNF2-related protein, partial [Candidatus Binatia bacterium]